MPMPGMPGAMGGADASPPWCQYVPEKFRDAACKGNVKLVETSASAEQMPGTPGAAGQMPMPGMPGATSGADASPPWCQYVPEKFRDAACKGNVKLVEGSASAEQMPGMSGAAGQMPMPGMPGAMGGADASPPWCQYVPEKFSDAACKGNVKLVETSASSQQAPMPG